MIRTETQTDMPDYFMHIQFIIRKVDGTKIILNKVLDYNKESYLILGPTFDIIIKYIVLLINCNELLKKYLMYNNTICVLSDLLHIIVNLWVLLFMVKYTNLAVILTNLLKRLHTKNEILGICS